MGCMLCGREIGPERLFVDNEFCSASHRELYLGWLNKAPAHAEVVQLRPAVAENFTPMEPPGAQLSVPLDELFPAPVNSPATSKQEPVELTPLTQIPPQADFVPLEYYCERVTPAPAPSLEWTWRSPVCALPKLGMKPAGERLEDLLPKKAPQPAFFPPAKPKAQPNRGPSRVLALAAAGVVLFFLIGYGARFAARIGTETPNARRDAAAPTVNTGGPFEKVRLAIANRAAVEMSDGFARGMEAWGHAKSWAPGWVRRPEGYIQPGQLALFQPSMKFTDYRMEFLGQIESKGMGWVVRARDPRNYYAMKFAVIQPGLRPIIAMVHYTVTDGHAGHRIETPLMEVMVHNDTAYHVTVTVHGNRIVTSIEGQEVDRWIEDRIPAGGVGFYSDAGERARLYWMRVAKNEDFLGKVCAYLTGSADTSPIFAIVRPPGWSYAKRYRAASY